MPKLSPRTASETTATSSSTAEATKARCLRPRKSIRVCCLSMSMPARSDWQFAQFAPAVEEVRQAPGQHDRREHRGQDADAQGDGEALDGPRAEVEQYDGGDQGGDVGVDDGRQGPLVAGVYARLRRVAVAQLFAYALEYQHVGVDGHAHGEHYAGDARQRQRGLEQGQHRDEQDEIHGQGDV